MKPPKSRSYGLTVVLMCLNVIVVALDIVGYKVLSSSGSKHSSDQLAMLGLLVMFWASTLVLSLETIRSVAAVLRRDAWAYQQRVLRQNATSHQPVSLGAAE